MTTLRERLSRPEIVVAPGAYDAFTARLIEAAGFEAVYLSGAGVSYSLLAEPDVGLVTLSEMVDRVRSIASAVKVPVICDGDNGHGNAMNLMRTVRLFEQAGAAAVQFEDQAFPKRCGHLAGKKLVSVEEMVGKIRAACAARSSRDFLIIGRTDARAPLGLDEAIRRAGAFLEAGADVLFVEAPQDRDELLAVARAFPGVPLVANMVEGGKTPSFEAKELEALGYRIVIYPNSLTRRFARAGAELLAGLRTHGTTKPFEGDMVSFGELNAIVGLGKLAELEKAYLPPEAPAAATTRETKERGLS
jgi:carboxyvinyl-carboxyphosphonate phosphorylmutase